MGASLDFSQLSSQRGTEASGGSAIVGKRCNGRCSHWFSVFIVAKNVTSAFQLFCATFLITLRVIASSMCFTLVPEEKLRFSTISKDFGC